MSIASFLILEVFSLTLLLGISFDSSSKLQKVIDLSYWLNWPKSIRYVRNTSQLQVEFFKITLDCLVRTLITFRHFESLTITQGKVQQSQLGKGCKPRNSESFEMFGILNLASSIPLLRSINLIFLELFTTATILFASYSKTPLTICSSKYFSS